MIHMESLKKSPHTRKWFTYFIFFKSFENPVAQFLQLRTKTLNQALTEPGFVPKSVSIHSPSSQSLRSGNFFSENACLVQPVPSFKKIWLLKLISEFGLFPGTDWLKQKRELTGWPNWTDQDLKLCEESLFLHLSSTSLYWLNSQVVPPKGDKDGPHSLARPCA